MQDTMDYKQATQICRSCLKDDSDDDLRSIFKIGKMCGQITTLSYMLNWITGIEPVQGDGLPEHICTKCVMNVSRAYVFKQLCLKSDRTLHERFINQKIIVENIDSPSNQLNDNDLNEIEQNSDAEDVAVIEIKCENNVVTEQPMNEVRLKRQHIENIQIIAIKNEFDGQEDDDDDDEEEEADDDDEEEQEHVSSVATKTEDNIIPKMVFSKYRKRLTEIPKPPYKCDVCSKVLSNYASYKYHIQLHSDETPFLCSDCGLGFKTRNAYDGHRITHSLNNPNTCQICGKSYRQAASLRSHMLSHSGEKPFLCGICGKGMTQKSGFKKHMLTHTGERPYKCDICEKPFRYSSNLIMHKRSHVGDKPYTCQICDKSFVGSEHLKRHALIHTDQKPFSCEFCDKRFNRKCSLQVHLSIHKKSKKTKLKLNEKKCVKQKVDKAV